jgi:predicted HNH restriction endonuclease
MKNPKGYRTPDYQRKYYYANRDGKYKKTIQAVKDRRQENRAYFIEKLGGCCSMCGYREHLSVLEFDHLSPDDKASSISALLPLIREKNEKRMWEEIKKCRLLCANCHRVESLRQGHIGRRRKESPFTP